MDNKYIPSRFRFDDYMQETKKIFDYLVDTNQIYCVPCNCNTLDDYQRRKEQTTTMMSWDYPQHVIYIFCKLCGYTLSSFNRELAKKKMESING